MSKRSEYEALLSNTNVVAMLNAIAVSEGCGNNYGCSFGGTILTLSSPRHPYSGYDCSFSTTGPRAVGRYQFCGTTWDGINTELGGLDFSNPRHQDIAAIALIARRGSLNAVLEGRIEDALTGKDGSSGYPPGLAYEWASLPPFRYSGQGTKTMAQFLELYRSFNGQALPSGTGSSQSLSDTASSVSSSPGMGGKGAQRKNCPEWDRSMRQGKVLTGCDMAGALGFGGSMSIAPGASQGVPGAAGSTDLVNVPIDVADLQGKLLWPVRNASGAKLGVRTSPFTANRNGRPHCGIDLASPAPGGYIVSAAPGVVLYASTDPARYQGVGFRGYGNTVLIEHERPNGKIWTLYAHLASIGISAGAQVQAGTGLGREGNTGASRGIHLHFEVRTSIGGGWGRVVDPWPLLDQTR